MKVVSDILTKVLSRTEQTDNRTEALISTTHISFKKLNHIYCKKNLKLCALQNALTEPPPTETSLLFCQASFFLLNLDPH